jgi:hypothetical protein
MADKRQTAQQGYSAGVQDAARPNNLPVNINSNNENAPNNETTSDNK